MICLEAFIHTLLDACKALAHIYKSAFLENRREVFGCALLRSTESEETAATSNSNQNQSVLWS